MNEFSAQILGTDMPCRFVDDDGMKWWLNRFREFPNLEIDEIGKSRQGRIIYGFTIGNGADNITTITAGAHADEPAGPMTAMLLIEALANQLAAGKELSEQRKFYICPQVNPDGAHANHEWFKPVPDLETYLHHVKREAPGDDVEFGYPGGGKGALRPENQAVADFFSSKKEPARDHISLHSMAFASGAWFLLNPEVSKESQLWEQLFRTVSRHGFRLHDMERNGDKGFYRMAPGFSTTPNSRAMARHFSDQDDPETADKFHFSSMEWAEARRNDVFAMVTELPMFALENGYQTPSERSNCPIKNDADITMPVTPAPPAGSTALERFREELKPLIGDGDLAGALALGKKYQITPVPFSAQVATMVDCLRTYCLETSAIRHNRAMLRHKPTQ